mmetsp:Transcript_3648/g.7555  ORF Transcript_3648/g.7555 Transcript_3648/m.7555 type:complete len:104 (+) Transcript_3648:1418-1729(+)
MQETKIETSLQETCVKSVVLGSVVACTALNLSGMNFTVAFYVFSAQCVATCLCALMGWFICNKFTSNITRKLRPGELLVSTILLDLIGGFCIFYAPAWARLQF